MIKEDIMIYAYAAFVVGFFTILHAANIISNNVDKLRGD